jgi:glycosyltransferase involved in cell wall biosynthesis
MFPPQLSVILCTHNPRMDYLARALLALRDQNLDRLRWEFILIDNASERSTADEINLSWHPHGRHVREEKLGLTHGRLRGVREASTDLFVFVDDDNVLAPDYLEVALRVSESWPILGTWGGQCEAEYENQPDPSLLPFIGNLAVRTCTRDSWSNARAWCEAYPYGAGLCVRRKVMEEYHRHTSACELRQSLGRTGQQLFSGEDYDINLTACDLGLGCGVFEDLKLTHLIPAHRVTEEYLLRVCYGHAYSNAVLFAARGEERPNPMPTFFHWVLWKLRLARLPRTVRRVRWAELTGARDAIEFLHGRRLESQTQAPVIQERRIPASS